MKNCNNCLLLEARKHKDLYMWMAKAPNGPSVKMLVQNVHTMSEVKLTGNCLKGARPLLVFDESFDTDPHYRCVRLTKLHSTPSNSPLLILLLARRRPFSQSPALTGPLSSHTGC